MITKEDNRIYQISSTFPIMSYGEIIGAIEFSKFLYKTDSLHNLKNHPLHKSLKKNNTIYTIDDIVTKDKGMLKKYKGIAAYAAKSLRISKQTMQYKLEKHGLLDHKILGPGG